MATRFSSTGLVVDGNGPAQVALNFLDSVLRGIGQVMLQNNPYAGLLFLAGIFYNSRLFGIAVLIGTVVGTLTAMLLRVAPSKVRDGLFGFNGALAAIALTYFFEPNALAWGYTICAVAMTSILMATMMQWLEPWKISPLTAPFVITTLCFLLAGASFGRLHPTHLLPAAELPKAAIVEGVVGLSTIGHGLLNGVAQVFFQDDIITGALFAIGLLISSRRAFTFALCGSLVGLLVSWGMGAPEPSIRAGVFGFNSVLTAIAMESVGFASGGASQIYALLAAIAATVVYATISTILQPVGMPALTLPFVLVVWVFALGAREFRKLQIPKPEPQPEE